MLLAGVSPEREVDLEALGDEIARMAAHLDAATHRLLACIRAFDASGEWHRQGALSCAHWLSWRIGLDPGTAREKVRVARALETLPLLDDGLRRGVLSYAKVRALTRVATPDNEASLVDIALSCTGAQLERLCRGLRRVGTLTEHGDRLDDRRFVSCETLESGMARISAVLHPDEAALIMKAIDEARVASPDVTVESPDLAAPKKVIPKADGLVHVARAYLAPGAQGTRTTAPAAEIVVHLQPDLLTSDGTLSATLDDGTRVSAETFRRLGCDAVVKPALSEENDNGAGNEKTRARGGRIVGPALRRALWARDRGCRFPGCSNRLFVHAHHLHHWAHGGATTADNLALLCTTHHRMVHDGGFTMRREPSGALSFADDRGRAIANVPTPPEVSDDGFAAIERLSAAASLYIDADTSTPPHWNGDALDYAWVIDGLIRRGAPAGEREHRETT